MGSITSHNSALNLILCPIVYTHSTKFFFVMSRRRSLTRTPSALEQGSDPRSKAVRRHGILSNPNIDAYRLTNPGPNKFVLLNNHGIAQHLDYISVRTFPTPEQPSGVATYYDESGTVDELTFTPVQGLRPVGSRVLTQACHTSSGQIFKLEIVVDSSGVKALLMHCGHSDIARFDRADLHPEEELTSYEEGELYTRDGVWVSEMDAVEF